MYTSIVRAGRYSNHLRGNIAINAFLAVLVGPHDNAYLISLEELLHLVRTELHNVVLLLGVTLGVGFKSHGFFTGHGVTPQNVDCDLLMSLLDIA